MPGIFSALVLEVLHLRKTHQSVLGKLGLTNSKKLAKPQKKGQIHVCRRDTGDTQNNDSSTVTQTKNPVVRTRTEERN